MEKRISEKNLQAISQDLKEKKITKRKRTTELSRNNALKIYPKGLVCSLYIYNHTNIWARSFLVGFTF